ncbi:MAG TPA: glutaredoxin 3 [Sphingopyxis sp.]|uniref:glutaredoxin 3 n=1 Tax=Sphingopyxis sp. TaxID=1908224 RepID=UPI002C947CBA|nr:glutaredoxin 3 [Sphingopyxis sp.]HWW58791.1 glutaredoxin 3 [Sphingopyxis sp.]
MARIEVYTKAFCPYCTRAKALLGKKGADFEEIDVTMDRAGFESMIERANGRRTVPQVFIDGRHVGGSDDLAALDAKGELDALLKAA